MKTATVSDFRANLKEHLESIRMDQDILIISGSKMSDFVVLTLEQFESMEETAHLLSSPANAARLAKGVKQARQGKISLKKIKI
jgi:antitoxin YefM